MKTLKILGIFAALFSSQVSFSMSENELSNLFKPEAFNKNESANELDQLRQKERLLKAILKNSDFIQFKDGTVIDLHDFEENEFKKPSSNSHSDDAILEKFQTIEGGGTGHGG